MTLRNSLLNNKCQSLSPIQLLILTFNRKQSLHQYKPLCNIHMMSSMTLTSPSELEVAVVPVAVAVPVVAMLLDAVITATLLDAVETAMLLE